MVAIYFEVFGLVWLHEQGEQYAAIQSGFTKNYLETKNRLDVWETMGHYNNAIAKSSTYGMAPDTEAGNYFLACLDKQKMDKFGSWVDQGIDPICAARAANRLMTEKPWKEGLTIGFLLLQIGTRLGNEVQDEAQQQLFAVIQGLYNGARESLRKVKIAQ
jgi:hypothetical protein